MFNAAPLAGLFRRGIRAIVLFAASACLLIAPSLPAQTTENAAKSARKLIRKVDADYPLELQRAHIGGVVRLDVVVTPKGTTDHIAVLGGNPVLVETAMRAVKQWKWAPADSASVIRININFDSDKTQFAH